MWTQGPYTVHVKDKPGAEGDPGAKDKPGV